MIYIIVALSAEARPIIDKLKLTPVKETIFNIYTSAHYSLVITGVGYENALISVSSFLTYFNVTSSELIINIGVCASSRKYSVGDLIVCNKISKESSSYYPDILFKHSFFEDMITTHEEPQGSYHEGLSDMEAHGVFKVASRFVDAHKIIFFKIVSDHYEIEKVTKGSVIELISKKLDDIFTFVETLKFNSNEIFTLKERFEIEEIKSYLSKTQSIQFEDSAIYYKLKHKKELPLEEFLAQDFTHKKERGEYVQRVINTLTK